MRNRFDDGGFATDPTTDILVDDVNQTNTDPTTGGGTVGSGGFDWGGALKNLGGLFTGATGGGLGQMAAFGGLAALLNRVLSSDAQKPVGYQGGIPGLTATRQQIARPADYQPGMGGISYFTPMQYRYTGQDLGGGKLGVSSGAAQGADPLQEFLTAIGTAAAPAASPAPAPTPSAAPAPPPATRVTTPAVQPGTTMRTQGVTTGGTTATQTGSTAAKTATTTPGTMYTGGTAGFDESKVGGTTTGGTTAKTATTGGATTRGTTGGTQFNLSRQDVTDLARQAAAQNPNVAAQQEASKTPSADDIVYRAFYNAGRIGMGEMDYQIPRDKYADLVNKVKSGSLDASNIDAAVKQALAATTTKTSEKQPTFGETYFKNPYSESKLGDIANKSTYTVGNNIIRSGQIGVQLDDDGIPAMFTYYDKDGRMLTKSAFNPVQFLKNVTEFDINPTDALGVEKGLKANNIKYLPYELYSGTGSDHGIDFRDLLSGGMGSAYDWTKDPNVAVKGPLAAGQLKEAQDLAQKLGLKYSQDKYQGGGIKQDYMTQLQGGSTPPRGWAMMGPNNSVAAWYSTEAEAKEAADKYKGNVVDLTGASVTSQDNRNNLTKDNKGNWVLKPGGAAGGLGAIIRGHAAGGLPALQSAGGRFLRGPGDGVSDSIEARFDRSGQPARLADGEFVLDARTVSEIGNGSSEAGARKLYAMMDRIHKARKKAGRGKDSGADKYLPA